MTPSQQPANVAHAVRAGLAAFVGRALALQGFRVVSAVVLARFLFPADYAVFGAVATLLAFLQFVADAGFSGAFTQQASPPDREELLTAFWLQQAVSWILVAVVCLAAGPLTVAFGLTDGAAWMLRCYAVILPLNMARLIPSVTLNRELRFKQIVWPEVAETLVLYAVQLSLAVAGARAWALVIGGLARAISGLAALSILAPWSPGAAWSPRFIPRALRFGAPFQISAAIASARAFIPSWLVLSLSTPTEVGFILWSLGLTGIMWQLAFILDRVFFPAVARLAADQDALTRSTTTLLLGGVGAVGMVAAIASPLAPWAVPLIFGPRWAPAVPILAILLWAGVGLIASYLTASVLNGLGHPHGRLMTVVSGTTLELVLTWFWVRSHGAAAYAWAVTTAAVVELIIAMAVVRRHVRVPGRPLAALFTGIAAAAVIGVAVPHVFLAAAMATIAFSLILVIGATPELAQVARHLRGQPTSRSE